MRAAAASVGGVSAPSTAPPSPVPRYPPAAWLPSQSGSLRSFLDLSPEAGLRVSSRQCQGPGAIPLSRLRTAPSTGRGDRAGTRELLSHLPPRDSGYTGDLGTSRHASPCSGPFSQTSPMPTLGGLPFPVLPTMGISGVGTPSAASWRLAAPAPTAAGAPQVRALLSPSHRAPLRWPSLSALPPPPAFIRSSPTEEQPASCRHLTELRNLTKGPCYLEQVEVSYCSGHCPSSTNVMPEVSEGAAAHPGGPATASLDLGKAWGT